MTAVLEAQGYGKRSLAFVGLATVIVLRRRPR